MAKSKVSSKDTPRQAESQKLLEELCFTHRLIGAISSIYDIPLAEIKELEKRMRQDEKIKEMIEAKEQKAAKKKFDKMIPRLNVVR